MFKNNFDKAIDIMVKNGQTEKVILGEIEAMIKDKIASQKIESTIGDAKAALIGAELSDVEVKTNDAGELVVTKVTIRGEDGKKYGLAVKGVETVKLYKSNGLGFNNITVE